MNLSLRYVGTRTQALNQTPSTRPVTFQGWNPALMPSDSWPTTDEFQKTVLTAPDTERHMGNLPAPLRSLGGEHAVLESLDGLSDLLRDGKGQDRKPFLETVAGKPVTMKYVSEGSHGTVYQLNVGGERYAFKVFHSHILNDLSLHGPYGELSGKGYQDSKNYDDIARFYCGRADKGWALYQWVAADTQPRAESGSSILQDPKIELFDHHSTMERARNLNAHGVVFDLGGIRKKPVQSGPALSSDIFGLGAV